MKRSLTSPSPSACSSLPACCCGYFCGIAIAPPERRLYLKRGRRRDEIAGNPQIRRSLMKGGQIAALVIGCLLLLPGGCFMLFGIGLASDTSDNLGGAGWMLIGIALAILAFAGLLFWIAFRKRAPAATSGPPAPPAAPNP